MYGKGNLFIQKQIQDNILKQFTQQDKQCTSKLEQTNQEGIKVDKWISCQHTEIWEISSIVELWHSPRCLCRNNVKWTHGKFEIFIQSL